MSKYLTWILQQEQEFIEEICGNKTPEKRFKDYRKKSITLDELKELDNKFIMGGCAAHLTVSDQEQ